MWTEWGTKTTAIGKVWIRIGNSSTHHRLAQNDPNNAQSKVILQRLPIWTFPSPLTSVIHSVKNIRI